MNILKQAEDRLYEEGFFSYYETRKREIMKISYILRSAKPEKAIRFLKKEFGALKLFEAGEALAFLLEMLAEKQKSKKS